MTPRADTLQYLRSVDGYWRIIGRFRVDIVFDGPCRWAWSIIDAREGGGFGSGVGECMQGVCDAAEDALTDLVPELVQVAGAPGIAGRRIWRKL